jgi:hypothetical protein
MAAGTAIIVAGGSFCIFLTHRLFAGGPACPHAGSTRPSALARQAGRDPLSRVMGGATITSAQASSLRRCTFPPHRLPRANDTVVSVLINVWYAFDLLLRFVRRLPRSRTSYRDRSHQLDGDGPPGARPDLQPPRALHQAARAAGTRDRDLSLHHISRMPPACHRPIHLPVPRASCPSLLSYLGFVPAAGAFLGSMAVICFMRSAALILSL